MNRLSDGLLLLFILIFAAACQAEEEVTATPSIAEPAVDDVAEPAATATMGAVPATNTVAAATAAEEVVRESTVTATSSVVAVATATPVPPVPSATPLPAAEPVSAIRLVPVASGFDQPTYLAHAYGERLFVVEQPGRIQILQNGDKLAEPFLDITDRVGSNASEQGLLSVAFHPNYAENGFFFVDYTNREGNTIIARYRRSDDPNQADRDSETILLTIEQPYGNHNGGQLQFGPDGYLYVGMGDGGSAGDPQNNGQDPSTLLGALLRLDVDNGDENLAYAIPPDNPYVNREDGRNEIWSIGVRNPWRFSFDRLTGDLFVADVGQNQYEEVNFVPAAETGGVNYGWNIMEGFHCFRSSDCPTDGLRLPVAEYDHSQGCSVTGGYIYRGNQFPDLYGNYFYGDFCSGLIWSLFPGGEGWQSNLVADLEDNITSFGEDRAGELYVVTQQGNIYQIQP